ncbi:hypothetical protein D3C85_1131250 [compost metagenome]
MRKVGFDEREQRLPVGAGHFGRLPGGRLHGDPGQRRRNVGRGHWLQGGRGQPHDVALGTGMSNGAHELEELGGPQDAVRHARRLDQLFLGHLGPEVTAVEHPFGAHDRQRHVVLDPGSLLGRKQVAPGGLEKRQHLGIFERG